MVRALPDKAHLLTTDAGQDLVGAGGADVPPPALGGVKHGEPQVGRVHLDWGEEGQGENRNEPKMGVDLPQQPFYITLI